MHEVDQSEIIRIIAPLVYRLTDKFFKFISWALLLVVLRYANQSVDSMALHVLNQVAVTLFSGALLLQAVYIGARDPATLGLPPSWHRFARPFQIVVAVAFVLAITSPALYVDQIIDTLARARFK